MRRIEQVGPRALGVHAVDLDAEFAAADRRSAAGTRGTARAEARVQACATSAGRGGRGRRLQSRAFANCAGNDGCRARAAANRLSKLAKVSLSWASSAPLCSEA